MYIYILFLILLTTVKIKKYKIKKNYLIIYYFKNLKIIY